MNKSESAKIGSAIKWIETGRVDVGVVLLRDIIRDAGHTPPPPMLIAAQTTPEKEPK